MPYHLHILFLGNSISTHHHTHSRIHFNSTNLFAFQQDDRFYSDAFPSEDDHSNNDTIYLPPGCTLGDTTFLSTLNDPSQISNANEDADRSYLTFDLEFEKQVNSLLYCEEDDDLNDAKLNLNNDISLLSSQSNTITSQPHNISTPLNFKRLLVENEDKSSILFTPLHCGNNPSNNRDLSQQSFSSLFETNKINPHIGVTTNTPQSNSLKGRNTISTMNNNTNNKNSFDFQQMNNSIELNLTNSEYASKYGLQKAKNGRCYLRCSGGNGCNGNDNNKFQLMSYKSFCNFNHCKHNGHCLRNNYIYNNNNHHQHNHTVSQIKNSEVSINNISRASMPMFGMFSYIGGNSTYNHNCKSTLDDNNNNTNAASSSKTFSNKMLAMIKDQNGSKIIQKKIEEKNSDFLNKLFDNIKNNLYDIITDQFGNYVVQKYVEYCDKKTLSKMLHVIDTKLYDISINSYGTRALQKILEYLTAPSQEDIDIILSFTKDNVLNLIRDINGNHVIQSILETIPNKEKLSSFYKELNSVLIDVAKIKQGGCVFPKVLSNIIESDLTMIANTVIDNISTLINDEYGNFIIQRIIKLNIPAHNDKIYDYIHDKVLKLSSMKYSSNVIETCLGDNISIRPKVIDKLIDKNNITILITDQFGNYIVQKCLTVLKGGDKFNAVVEQIKKSVKNLNSSGHGRKIYDNLVKKFGNVFHNGGNSHNNSLSGNCSSNNSSCCSGNFNMKRKGYRKNGGNYQK